MLLWAGLLLPSCVCVAGRGVEPPPWSQDSPRHPVWCREPEDRSRRSWTRFASHLFPDMLLTDLSAKRLLSMSAWFWHFNC